ncbi:hypothetical protein [Flagellimonas flava]|uniref:hypothetical protein n=1 Tax=Flagellimonas flava TaxID=570519 RepID=UPI003D648854
MTNKELCLSLMKADTENEVIEILKAQEYWSDYQYWRFYGDKENNYSAAGNQADESEAALVEKITNSRDAILMNECLIRGIDPKSDSAPKGVQHAVARFFEDDSEGELAGQVREWSTKKRREVAKNISVYITGNKPSVDKYPCINIADKGEGQTPLNMPKTILSLGESIKRKISFVHGKWNMGGTAALVYCGKENLQLIVSKRNPKLLGEDANPSDNNWSFTLVRRENPEGKETSSTYKYLAPVNVDMNPAKGELLNFESDTLPIFAQFNEPYSVESEWGTLVKLYEYETKNKQNVQGNGGLLRPLDLLAPDLGLPFRLHECRYEGTPGSFEHQVNGLRVRLHDDRGKALEEGYPTSNELVIDGEQITITVYAFKDDKAKTYRDNDKGVIFILNGQSQGWLDDRLFSRNKVGLGFLKNSLLVMVNCSELSYRAQEKLFVNDRVHLRKGPFRDKIITEIIDYLSHHQGLSDIQEERKRKLKQDKISDSKPIEAVLSNVFKHSSALSRIFLNGHRLSNPFKSKKVKDEEKPFKGELYPKYFKFKRLDYGEELKKGVNFDSRSRIFFETDAKNDYFNRKTKPGSYKLLLKSEEDFIEVTNTTYSLNLLNGIATLNLDINSEYEIGRVYNFKLVVTDPLRIVNPPFANSFELTIHPKAIKKPGKAKPRTKPPGKDKGDNRESLGGIQIPEITSVYEKDWDSHEFNKYSALKVLKSKSNSGDGEQGEPMFDFFVNMDNVYLSYEIKDNIKEKELLESQYKYGMLLLGISLIYDSKQNSNESSEVYEGVEDKIFEFSRAMSPMIIPMIQEFGDLDLKSELIDQLAD